MKKLKPTHLRKPSEIVSYEEMVKDLADETGFTRVDVDYVITTYLSMVKKELLERRLVKLKGLGSLFPIVKASRLVTNLKSVVNGIYSKFEVAPKWYMKFIPEPKFKKEVGEIMVTKRDLEKIYYKEK
jgi:nucleoid DNA-binding protein